MAAQTNGSTSGSVIGATRSDDILPKELVDEMQALFGKHLGYRTTHAKGLLVEGLATSATPRPSDGSLFCCGGLSHVRDINDGTTPKGIATRFKIDNDTYTDLIAHSFDGFATRTGDDFLAFLQVFRAFKVAQFLLEKAKAGAFLTGHPLAAVFVNSPKPNPFNYGTITYYEPNTHNKDGKVTNVRYRLDPADGEHLYPNDLEQLKKLGQSYLEDDLKQRFPDRPIVFTIQAHIADPTDVLDDATILYKSTTNVPISRLEINKVADDNATKQQQIAFSPTPDLGGIEGIAPSKDPLI
ncbi:catalase-like domain-containing protein [Hypoxylon crocopeplum]|nr:catalase-like domain-containing protein [Hypoxylon crocopeplum]